jgi:hypothetical protein
MKQKLHPNLIPAGFSISNGSENYTGGSFILFGVCFDISFDEKDGGWIISNTNIDDDEVAKTFLSLAHSAYPEGFSDESEVKVSEVKNLIGEDFYRGGGERYLVLDLKDEDGNLIAARVDAKTKIPTGETKVFYDDELIYIYEDEEDAE